MQLLSGTRPVLQKLPGSGCICDQAETWQEEPGKVASEACSGGKDLEVVSA